MRPLESIHRHDVTELGLDHEKPESLRFDVKRDVTEEDWERFETMRVIWQANGDRLAETLACIDDLDRSRLNVNTFEWQVMNTSLAEKPLDYLKMAANLQRIDSGKALINSQKLHEAIRQVTHERRSPPARARAGVLADLAAVDPEWGRLAEPDWPMIMERLNHDRQSKLGDWLAEILVGIARLDPKKLNVTDDDWRLMREALEKYRLSDPESFLSQAAEMAVIARATTPPAQPETVVPLPVTKSYS